MSGLLVPVLFWLSIPSSLVFSVIGVVKKNSWLVLLGAVLFFPLSYYMNGSPSSRGLAILLPFFQVASSAAVREQNQVWAWLLLLPAFLVVLWFLGVVLFYQLS